MDPKNPAAGEARNIADALADHLPKAEIVNKLEVPYGGQLLHIAVPKTANLAEIDTEKWQPNPRRAIGTAHLDQASAFVAYVNRHLSPQTVVWCKFNPQTFELSFTAVFDDHASSVPGWRGHRAKYTPNTSAEWKVWKGQDRKAMAQLVFAEFIEANSKDIAGRDGHPTDLQMLQMATDLELNSDKRIKSVVRIQGGGTRLDYVDDQNAETLEQMKAFDRFQIGIPVFWGGAGYYLNARLKYRQQQSQVNFTYELHRADKVHEDAALALIAEVRTGIEGVPLLMGAFD